METALIEITSLAESVFGSRLEAKRWLRKPVMALDGRIPTELLATQSGVDLVRDHLTRMEYCVYA